ncbi:ABC transporter ATP-binding protein [Halobacteriales archaeon QS_1_68_20]|nr:MAG: ABC transporter ATP-binding protein [Halobacteriales archaeon QS_1_68_20]
MNESELDYEGGDLQKEDPLLRVEDLRKTFGGVVAADDATFAVERGSITGLIGPNGAGKSTLFNLISGFYEPDGGAVYLGDEEITGMRPDQIAQKGLIRTFQTPRKLEGMTVRESLLVAPAGQRGESLLPLWTSPSSVTAQEDELLDRAEDLLSFFEIDHLATEPSPELSGGQLKLVELARAMMTDPDVLLLDEPVAGVNPVLEEKLAEHIRRLNEEQGVTVLLIEHDMEFIMDLADPIVVLDQGRVLVEGTPEAVRTDDRVVDAYLGGVAE